MPSAGGPVETSAGWNLRGGSPPGPGRGIQAFSRESPDAKSRGGWPPAPLFMARSFPLARFGGCGALSRWWGYFGAHLRALIWIRILREQGVGEKAASQTSGPRKGRNKIQSVFCTDMRRAKNTSQPESAWPCQARVGLQTPNFGRGCKPSRKPDTPVHYLPERRRSPGAPFKILSQSFPSSLRACTVSGRPQRLMNPVASSWL